MTQSTAFTPTQTPPSSPSLRPDLPIHGFSLNDLKAVLVDLHKTIAKLPEKDSSFSILGGPLDVQLDKPRIKASKLDFKVVDERWNAKEYKYKIWEAPPAEEVVELDEYIFVVRKRTDRHTGDLTSFIDINSTGLRDFMRQILKDVRGIDLRENKLSIDQNVLFHFIDHLRDRQRDEPNHKETTTGRHLSLLLNYMEDTFKTTKAHLKTLLEHQEITYELLWALFPPNTLVFTKCSGTGKPQCLKYDFGEEKKLNGMLYFSLHCRYLDFDGKLFGEVPTELPIVQFRGTQKIQNLASYPLRYHPKQNEVSEQLKNCGLKFATIMKMNRDHRHCQGIAYYMRNDQPVQVTVNSRIMLDPEFFREMNPNYRRPCIEENRSQSVFFDMDDAKERSNIINGRSSKAAELAPDELLICCPTIPGFSLDSKQWLEFAVADVEQIQWSSSTFDGLTIPKARRETLLALAKAHTGHFAEPRFDDVVARKGRGLIVLLHGPPGVGKTLTAEGISEELEKPLYSISSGELSHEVGKLEMQLATIFQIAEQWDAILLLDEADVFVEARTLHSLERNALVAAFLRKLEHCASIMFMTTNRVENFDLAILSRIHLKFEYPNLDKTERRQVWRSNLERANTLQGKVSLRKNELDDLVDMELNGREIKNVVATAHALATGHKTVVTISQLLQTVNLSKEFSDRFGAAPEHMYK